MNLLLFWFFICVFSICFKVWFYKTLIETMTTIFRPFTSINFKHTHTTIDVALSVFLFLHRYLCPIINLSSENERFETLGTQKELRWKLQRFSKQHYKFGRILDKSIILFTILFLKIFLMALPLPNILNGVKNVAKLMIRSIFTIRLYLQIYVINCIMHLKKIEIISNIWVN